MRALALLLALVACSPPDRGPRFRAAGGPPRAGGTLHIAIVEGVSTLDPAIAYDEVSYYVVHPLFDTLVDYAPGSTEVIPRLAERWEISPDGKTFRFWMRPNLRYARAYVKPFCDERSVPYTETSLFAAYRIVVRYLNKVGLSARDPFQCPMVAGFRPRG